MSLILISKCSKQTVMNRHLCHFSLWQSSLYTNILPWSKKLEILAPPGMAECKGLLTPSSKFSYSIAIGCHQKNPRQADCFCLCSTMLILMFLMDFVIQNRAVSLLQSQFLFFVKFEQEFWWQLLDLHTQNHTINGCGMLLQLHFKHWHDCTCDVTLLFPAYYPFMQHFFCYFYVGIFK